MRKILILHVNDNVAVALTDISQGELISQDEYLFTAKDNIARGHKLATRNISINEGIIKYGERMGHATSEIRTGEHVHVHNVLGDRLSSEVK
ncbi:MAG: UxaA family hydrolase [Actinomycetes bacterium]